MRKGIITRDLKPKDYYWLSEIIPTGTVVDEFMGCTYGCISSKGVAIILPGVDYFIEVPRYAVKWEVQRNEILGY
jgi:hypothetical protein